MNFVWRSSRSTRDRIRRPGDHGGFRTAFFVDLAGAEAERLAQPHDLGLQHRVLVRDGTHERGRQIHRRHRLEATHGRLAETGGEFPPFTREHYGLGWHIGKYDKFAQLHHFGGFAGFSTHVSFLPQEGLGVAVMVNDAVAGTRVMNLLAAYAYDWWLQREKAEKNGQKGLDEITKRMEKVGEMVAKGRAKRAERTWQLALPFEAYAGVYYNDSLGTLKVANADNALEVSIGNLHCTATPYTDENSIRIELVPGSGEVILFDVKDDKVASFRYDNTVFEKVQ